MCLVTGESQRKFLGQRRSYHHIVAHVWLPNLWASLWWGPNSGQAYHCSLSPGFSFIFPTSGSGELSFGRKGPAFCQAPRLVTGLVLHLCNSSCAPASGLHLISITSISSLHCLSQGLQTLASDTVMKALQRLLLQLPQDQVLRENYWLTWSSDHLYFLCMAHTQCLS